MTTARSVSGLIVLLRSLASRGRTAQCAAPLTFISTMICALYDMKSGLVRLSMERGRGSVIGIVRAMRPGRADMTSTRSARRIASSMSWVTNNTEVRRDCRDVEEQLLHLKSGLSVQCAEWFVHQQCARLHNQNARQPDALPHTA